MVAVTLDGAEEVTRRAQGHDDQPLRSWGDALRQDREARQKRRNRVCLVGLGCAFLVDTIVLPPAPRLLWNASASAPIGLYSVEPSRHVGVGDIVVAQPPMSVRNLAAVRHYLPLGVPLVKQVAAGPGDTICADNDRLLINGLWVVSRRLTDPSERPMPVWHGCHVLHDGQYLLLMTKVPTSFDGRYFGITDARDIIGTAHLLWAR